MNTTAEILREKSEDEELLERLKKLVAKAEEGEYDEGEDPLTKQQVKKLKEMIAVYESIQALGRFAKFMRNVVLFLGTLIVGWFALIDNFSSVWKRLFNWIGGG